jgi:F0F1-type ATP synthase assembly protein I
MKQIMSSTAHKTQDEDSRSYHVIFLFSAWGFVLVVTSLLFLWLGHLMDDLLGTSPKFMLGMLLLAVIGCFIELYAEVLKIMKDALTAVKRQKGKL